VFEAFEAHRRFLKLAIENEHAKPSSSTTPQDLLSGCAISWRPASARAR